LLFAFAALSSAAVGIAGITVVVTNSTQGIRNKAITDEHGDFAFPSLQVGASQLEIQAPGFRLFKRTGITINADSALKEDVKLKLAAQSSEVTVAASTQIGEVVSAATMAAVALNGRSFTDLIVMAGATVAIARPGGHVIVTRNPGRDPGDDRQRVQSIKRPSDGWKWPGVTQ
jgi:hypothetical protein